MRKKISNAVFLLILMTIIFPLQACKVSATSDFDVQHLDVAPSEVSVGKKFTVIADVKNSSNSETTFIVPVMVNGIADDRVTLTLAPGQSQEVKFTLARSKAGQYDISIGSKNTVVTVKNALPAEFKISDLKISGDKVEPDSDIVITARISNTGGSQGDYIAELIINGTAEQTEKLSMTPGGNYNIVFKVTKNDPGTYTVAIGDLTGKFTVLEPVRQIQLPGTTICPPGQSSSCCP